MHFLHSERISSDYVHPEECLCPTGAGNIGDGGNGYNNLQSTLPSFIFT